MKEWITKIRAIDPQDGEMKEWIGPVVPGETLEEAEQYCQENGFGYCKVDSIFIDEYTDEDIQARLN